MRIHMAPLQQVVDSRRHPEWEWRDGRVDREQHSHKCHDVSPVQCCGCLQKWPHAKVFPRLAHGAASLSQPANVAWDCTTGNRALILVVQAVVEDGKLAKVTDHVVA